MDVAAARASVPDAEAAGLGPVPGAEGDPQPYPAEPAARALSPAEAAGVDDLAALLKDSSRPYAVVVVSAAPPAQHPLVDVARLTALVDPFHARVFVVGSRQARRLTHRLPTGTSVWGGAARLYPPFPGLLPDDPRSRLFVLDRTSANDDVLVDIAATVRTWAAAARDAVATAKDAGERSPDRLDYDEVAAERDDARRRLEETRTKLASLRLRARDAEQSTVSLSHRLHFAEEEAAALSAEVAALRARVAEAEQTAARSGRRTREIAETAAARVQAATTAADAAWDREREVRVEANREATEARRALQVASAERDRHAESLREARQQLRSLQDAADELRRRAYGQRVYDDPERQVRHEVETAYLASVPEAERASTPLRRYRLGAEFAASLAELEPELRARAVDVVVDVLTRRAITLAGRAVRQLGDGGTAAVTGQRTRADGAAAWRCNVQDHTPQARRLLWWELCDGTVELGRVALHDDMRLR